MGVWDRKRAALWQDEGGAVSVEYTVLVVALSLGLAAAVVALGVPLWNRYHLVKAWIGLPIP